jgi:hypothetical protein
MILKTKIRIKSKYKGGSKFSFWKNLVPGDILYISLEVKRQDRNINGVKAIRLNIVDSENNKFECRMTELSNYLEKIEYEDVDQKLKEIFE